MQLAAAACEKFVVVPGNIFHPIDGSISERWKERRNWCQSTDQCANLDRIRSNGIGRSLREPKDDDVKRVHLPPPRHSLSDGGSLFPQGVWMDRRQARRAGRADAARPSSAIV